MNAIEARALADKKNAEVANAVRDEMLIYVNEELSPNIQAEAEQGNYKITVKFPADVRFTVSAVRKELAARGYTTEYQAKQKILFIVW